MEMGGIMMNPRGVKAITASRAMSRESWTRLRVFAVVLDIGINLLAAAPKGMQRILFMETPKGAFTLV